MKELLSKIINKETISYVFFGVMTTVVSIVSYELVKLLLTGGGDLTPLKMNTANIASWILAVAFAFVTNKFFVFNSKSTELKVLLREIPSFVGARIVSLVFEIVWMNVTVGVLHINDSIAKIGAQIGIVIMNYIFSKLFIFKKK